MLTAVTEEPMFALKIMISLRVINQQTSLSLTPKGINEILSEGRRQETDQIMQTN